MSTDSDKNLGLVPDKLAFDLGLEKFSRLLDVVDRIEARALQLGSDERLSSGRDEDSSGLDRVRRLRFAQGKLRRESLNNVEAGIDGRSSSVHDRERRADLCAKGWWSALSAQRSESASISNGRKDAKYPERRLVDLKHPVRRRLAFPNEFESMRRVVLREHSGAVKRVAKDVLLGVVPPVGVSEDDGRS